MKNVFKLIMMAFFMAMAFTSCTVSDISDLEPINENVKNLVGEDGNIIEDPDAG